MPRPPFVSHFILNREDRLNYFRQIASRLRSGGWLVNADLSGDSDSVEYPAQMEVWLRMMGQADFSEEQFQNMRAAYARDVAILPPREVASQIAGSGFECQIQFHQAMLIHGWFASRSAGPPASISRFGDRDGDNFDSRPFAWSIPPFAN